MGNKARDLAKLIPEIRERIPDLPPSPAGDPSEERIHLFESVASFLVSASRASAIMLHLEDLHWADQPSLQLLQHLARRTKGSRMVVVGTYRDVELDRRHPLSAALEGLRRERLYERVLLRGLSESEVKELIEAIWQQQVAGGSGEAFVRAILHETEGNPFFIEEVLRHLVESGGLYRRYGRWVTEPKAIAEMKVPEDVRDVIGRRLARLSETTHLVLAAAAVLGREFEFEVLSRMTELTEETMVPAVEEALSHRIVLESQDRARYLFTHALVRQTLYEELSLPRRQHLHLKAAQAIEAVHERYLEPHVASLANHYRSAGATADQEKTIDYSVRAGCAAYALFAYEEAGAHWRAALEPMVEQGGGDRKRRANLLSLLGDELISSGATAIEYLEAAALLFEELGDDQAACDVHTRVAGYLATGHQVGAMDRRRAMPHYKKAEAILAKQPESYRHAGFYLGMASACSFAVEIRDGFVAAKRAMEISERLDQPSQRDFWLSLTAIVSSLFHIRCGSVADGLRLADQARRRSEPINDTIVGSAIAMVGSGHYLFLLRSPREAKEWVKSELAKPRTARALRRVAPNAPQRETNTPLTLHRQLVLACTEAGELTEARAHLLEVDGIEKPAELLFFEGEWELTGKALTKDLERWRTAGSLMDESSVSLELARLHRFTGERAQAVQFLLRRLEICVRGGDLCFELPTRCALATMAAEDGNLIEALPHLQRCRQIVSAGENWFGIGGSVERAEAVVAAVQGENTAAETHFKKAIATFQHYCLPWEEADTLQYWGRALRAAGEHPCAMEKFDAAIEIYRSRGAGTRFIDYVMGDKNARLTEP
jgi:tetratricopeptide (TPR) repeat protein